MVTGARNVTTALKVQKERIAQPLSSLVTQAANEEQAKTKCFCPLFSLSPGGSWRSRVERRYGEEHTVTKFTSVRRYAGRPVYTGTSSYAGQLLSSLHTTSYCSLALPSFSCHHGRIPRSAADRGIKKEEGKNSGGHSAQPCGTPKFAKRTTARKNVQKFGGLMSGTYCTSEERKFRVGGFSAPRRLPAAAQRLARAPPSRARSDLPPEGKEAGLSSGRAVIVAAKVAGLAALATHRGRRRHHAEHPSHVGLGSMECDGTGAFA